MFDFHPSFSPAPVSMRDRFLFIALLPVAVVFFCTSCSHHVSENTPNLTTVVLQDRNGFSETVSQRDRLARLEDQDFYAQQSYQKVIRVFNRQQDGSIPSILTTYHPNGQLHHLLEISNGRAQGLYEQHYPSGELKLKASIVGGVADLTETAMATWQFDGDTEVYFTKGILQARIPYRKGVLDGLEERFHPNGSLACRKRYSSGAVNGLVEEWYEMGQLAARWEMVHGKREGKLEKWNRSGLLLDEEIWSDDRLIKGRYFSIPDALAGLITFDVSEGYGWCPRRSETGVHEAIEVNHGIPCGRVKRFDDSCRLIAEWEQMDGQKHGLEKLLHAQSKRSYLEMTWVEGVLSGPCRSYYPSGQSESHWEMLDNQRHGRSVAWYRNGSIMLIEDYDRGRLLKGEYYAMGEPHPISLVQAGFGTATLFQGDGRPLRVISIQNGEPVP